MRTFTQGHERVLKALADFRLLSVKQMQAAGAGRDPKHLRGLVQELRQHKLIRALPNENRAGEAAVARFMPGEGRRALLYYLSPKGAQAWGEISGETAPTVREKPYTFSSKVDEWEALTDTHLALTAWAAAVGARLDFYQADYEPGAGGLQRSTCMEFEDTTQTPAEPRSYVPDGLAGLMLGDGRPALLTVDVYMGGWQRRVAHFQDQLPHLLKVVKLAVPERTYGLDKLGQAARYLILFRNDAMRDAALRGWIEPENPVWGRFFVKSMPELVNFNEGWRQPNRAQRALFR